jgi:hypothetical protein
MGILARSLGHRVHVKYLRKIDNTTRFKDRVLLGGSWKTHSSTVGYTVKDTNYASAYTITRIAMDGARIVWEDL